MLGCFPLGTQLLGAMPLDVDPGLSIVIGGGEVSNKVQVGKVQIQNTLSQRSTADLTIVDHALDFVVDVGMQIFIRWQGSTYFSGTVEEVNRILPPTEAAIWHGLRCVDFMQVLDRFVITAAYEGMTLRAIVSDIVFVQNEGKLAREGISIDEVATGPTIDTARFNLTKVSDALRELAEATGFIWGMNPNWTIFFADARSFPAPFSVDDSNEIYRKLEYQKQRKTYRNRQFLRGGVDRTDERIQNFRGDATGVDPSKRRRTFTVDLPVAETPTIVRLGPEGPPVTGTQRVGIREKDKDGDLTIPSPTTWPQWFYQVGKNEISQNSAVDEVKNPTLTGDGLLIITYVGQFPIIVDALRDDLIADRAAVEGGTGEYQAVEVDEKVDGRDLAVEKATHLLEQFGRLPGTLSYEIDLSGMTPGMLQTQTFARLGIAAVEFLVNEVQISFLPGRTWIPRYRIKSLDSEKPGHWVDWFRRWIESGKPVVLHENEVLTHARAFKEQVEVTDSASVGTSGSVPSYTVDPYSFALAGRITVSGRPGGTMYRAVAGRSIAGRPYGM